MPHSQGLSNNPYPELNYPIPRTNTQFFKIHPNIVLLHFCWILFYYEGTAGTLLGERLLILIEIVLL